jgi:AAA15 family ATPase/GTPase
MIHYLKMQNFGPVKDEAEINFEVAENIAEDAYEVVMPDGRKLLKLAYIYGANASGKTTILKAIDFLRSILLRPAENKASELNFDPFLFCEGAYDIPSYFELSFYMAGLRYIYTINFNKQSILNEKLVFYQSIKPTELFTRETDIEKRLAKIQFGSKIKIPARERDLIESNTLHNNTVFGAYARTNVDIPELEDLNKWFSMYLLGMVTSAHNLTEVTASLIDKNPKINDWINDFLNKADKQITQVMVPEWNDQIGMPLDDAFHYELKNRIISQGSTTTKTITKTVGGALLQTVPQPRYYGGPSERRIDFMHQVSNGKNYPLSIQKESSGTKRYFGLGGPLYELIHGSHLLCIDELETSLHPDLMKHFLQVFLMNAGSSQMLITTHNLSLMEDQDFIRRDALWFSEKGSDGSVSLFSAADFDTTTLRKDASLINAYKTGRLGAKPNLGSPYLTE